ncbi:MAG TPA: hypothetical protein PK906_13740 [Spirochaetota bacterium]|nr:hypothetical protein [Spirochaetota bacterium]
MKCNDAVEKFMELDDYRDIPFLLRLHFLFCRKCRGEVAAMTAALDILSSGSPYAAPRGLAGSIMNSILRQSLSHAGKISGVKWVSAGTVIFMSILLINFSDSFIWLKQQFGSLYTLPLSIVLGLVLTAYLSFVVGCNYEAVKKYYTDHFHK